VTEGRREEGERERGRGRVTEGSRVRRKSKSLCVSVLCAKNRVGGGLQPSRPSPPSSPSNYQRKWASMCPSNGACVACVVSRLSRLDAAHTTHKYMHTHIHAPKEAAGNKAREEGDAVCASQGHALAHMRRGEELTHHMCACQGDARGCARLTDSMGVTRGVAAPRHAQYTLTYI
jgi:hypothetical protein